MNSNKLLFVTTLLFSLFVNAQLDKKNWLVGGSGSFDSYKEKYIVPSPNIGWEVDRKEIDISASVGYFIIDKLVIGAKPTFFYSNGGYYQHTKLLIGPFVKYYLLNKEKPFNIFVETSYQTGINGTPDESRIKGKYNKFTVMSGTEIFFNSTVGLEVLIGYKATKETIDPSQYSTETYTDIRKGFQVAVGFQIHLEKK